MLVSEFDYDLPPDRIALAPASPREAAKLLVVGADGSLQDRTVGDLPSLLRPGDALVVNDTRVIAARLHGVRARGDAVAGVEITLLRRLDASRWTALARPAKKLKVGERIRFGDSSESRACLLGSLDAEVEAKGEAGEVTLSFAFSGPALDEAIDALGEMPLPPYIAARRAPGASDRRDYQTVFAAEPGAVAAPTAGLHFTPSLVARVEAAGASLHRVTLHVGAGTFLPVKADDTDGAPHARGMVSHRRGDGGRPQRARRQGRPHRRRRHHEPEGARKRRGRRRAPKARSTATPPFSSRRATISARSTC